MQRILLSLVTAMIGGTLFKLAHLPVPWLLGPMVAVLLGSVFWKGRYEWPIPIRNAGMIVVGYTIGLSMTATALRDMFYQLPSMLLMTALLLLLCAGIAYVVSRLSGIGYKTALLASIPGGLSQVLALAEEIKGVNFTVVAVTQVIRLMIIVISVPLLIFSPIFGGVHGPGPVAAAQTDAAAGWSGLLPNMPVFVLICVGCALAGNKLRFPTAFFLGPAIGTAVAQLAGLHGPALPPLIVNAAQLMLGTYIGLLLKPELLERKLQTITLAVGSGLLLVLGACGLGALLTVLHPVSASTGLLSLAPGGMDQMGIIAHEIRADLSMVAGYQLFRTLFIFFAVPPLLRLLFRFGASRRGPSPERSAGA